MALLEAREVTCRYGSVTAVDAVNLTVEAGQIHGLIGPNGAGKSTCLDVLSGRRPPDDGHVLLDGVDITGRPVRWRRRAGIGRSFQRTSIFPGLTVRDQLSLVARRLGEPDLAGIVELLELVSQLDQRCDTLAYGDQRRVDIALALIGRPRLLLLDEPTAGVSAEEGRRLTDHLRDLALDREVTVLLVEHDLDLIFRLCDMLTVFDLGQVVTSDRPDEVRAHPRVVEAYLGRQS